MDRGAWWTTVHEVAESDMTEDIRPLQGLLFARVFTGGPVKLRCLLKSAECLWVLPTEAGPRTGTRLLVLPWPSRPRFCGAPCWVQTKTLLEIFAF